MKPTIRQLLLMMLVIMLAAACKKTGTVYHPETTPQITEQLQTMIDKVLTDYKMRVPGYPGGIALQVKSKKGTFFVTAGMENGINQAVHFRAASNTKLFTATAVLLLAQQGKLKIDAKIIDTIPGTQMTYVPMTGDYQIPYRDLITISQLLHHRAGVFDVSNNAIPDTVSVQVPYKGKDYITFIED